MAATRLRGILKRKTKRLEGAAANLAESARRRATVQKILLLVSLVVVSVLAFGRAERFGSAVEEGDVWRQDNLLAPFEFAIRKPVEVVARERTSVRSETPPIFRSVPNGLRDTQERRDTLAARMQRALEWVTAGRRFIGDARGETDTHESDSARAAVQVPLSARQWQLLGDSYLQTGRYSAERLDVRLIEAAYQLSMRLEEAGVLDVPIDSVWTGRLTVRDDDTRQERYLDRGNVHGEDQVFREARAELVLIFGDRPDTVAVGTAIVGFLLEPSLRFDAAATSDAIEARLRGLSPSEGAVRQNEVIVRQGDVVTADILQKLVSLEQEESQRRGTRFRLASLLGQILLTFTVYLIFFLYLFLLRRPLFDDNRMVLLMTILFGSVIGMYAIAVRIPSLDMYVVPITIVAVLLTVIFDSRVAIFGLLTLTLLGSLYRGFDFTFALSTLFGGSLGVFSVRDIRNRGQFFLSAGLVFVGYATVLFGAYLVEASSVERLLNDLLFTGISSVLLLLAYPLLWVFERSFDLTTDLSLLELSDTNRPLLKELSLRAPGTFSHVLQVANLAEGAASAIGANALLARVGALYHDIGKMVKPEYFVENQRLAGNPHDQLKPLMSALIIASHVKEGLELGRQYRIPQRVLDFIPMHHGTMRIEYFYRRATEQQGPEDPPVLEGEFRYPGPRPDSKESAILMLADSVEAASRALKNPTQKRLDSLIDSIIQSRVSDGQLDEADLTFKDLTIIKETLVSILLGVYHVRIQYPGGDDLDEVDHEGPENR